jgi:acetyl esterase/lipase
VKPETLSYETNDGSALSLDFYRAESPRRAPLVVTIHGGAWNSGYNKDFIPMDQFLAGRGYAVADVIYRLAPQSPFPAASNDVIAAMAFLRRHATELNLDSDRVVLLGRSAGGQIALHVAYTANDPAIRGVIAFYAPTDLNWSWEHPGNPLVIDTRAVLRDYLGGSPSQFPDRYAAASPIHLATSSSPPTLLLHGDRDELVSVYHSAALSRRLSELGVLNMELTLGWATHGFDYVLRGPGGQLSTYVVVGFLSALSL